MNTCSWIDWILVGSNVGGVTPELPRYIGPPTSVHMMRTWPPVIGRAELDFSAPEA